MVKLANKSGADFLLIFLLFLCSVPLATIAQLDRTKWGSFEIDYANPRKMEIGGIIISGARILDPNALTLLTGLRVGDEIDVPGIKISNAIKNLWKQGLFSDIEVRVNRIEGRKIFLEFFITEQPRLSRFQINGVSKSEADDIREEIKLFREKIVTDNLRITTKTKIRSYFVEKGYYNTAVDIVTKNDSAYANHVVLIINVDKKKKVKIDNIYIHGNAEVTDGKIRKTMKETKEQSRFRPLENLPRLGKDIFLATFSPDRDSLLNVVRRYKYENINLMIFKSSKFIRSQYNTDKATVLDYYKELGFRDAKIIEDSVSATSNKGLRIDMVIDEGRRYYFRNIDWVGNTKYETSTLKGILGIEKGDIYNTKLLDQRLFMNPTGLDISSKYMDDGYLFFQVNPVERQVDGDSIDLEIQIQEGTQARINRISISGNTKTNEHVIRREIRTKPGELFSRTDIMRTQQELTLLGFLDPEQMDVVPIPDPVNGTVDIQYKVGEKPSDQVELSGGFGGGRLLGTLGLTFNNFSLRNLFNGSSWRPLPSGDGQRLSIRGQTSGAIFNSINLSFTEPWLGGKRPNALTVSTYYTLQTNGQRRTARDPEGNQIENPTFQSLDILGFTVGLGRRLTWPDDNFQLYVEGSYQYYDVNKWPAFQGFSNGFANNIFTRIVLTRSSIDDPNFPKSGSRISLSAQLTPPYSWFNDIDYATATQQERFKFVEYHKWKFTAAWYNNFVSKFVVYAKVGFGGLFEYSRFVGTAPFERFYLGGSGLTGFNLDAREIIALRGYDDGSLSPLTGAPFVTRYTAEIRYPFANSPSAMVYGLFFAEMGNTWQRLDQFSPFNNYRSGGVGVRVFLPMFGLLGLDWGYRFDDVPAFPFMERSQLHFTIGANLGEL